MWDTLKLWKNSGSWCMMYWLFWWWCYRRGASRFCNGQESLVRTLVNFPRLFLLNQISPSYKTWLLFLFVCVTSISFNFFKDFSATLSIFQPTYSLHQASSSMSLFQAQDYSFFQEIFFRIFLWSSQFPKQLVTNNAKISYRILK